MNKYKISNYLFNKITKSIKQKERKDEIIKEVIKPLLLKEGDKHGNVINRE